MATARILPYLKTMEFPVAFVLVVNDPIEQTESSTPQHDTNRRTYEKTSDRPTSLVIFKVLNAAPPSAFPGPFIAFSTQNKRE